jgi:hypothetical protein
MAPLAATSSLVVNPLAWAWLQVLHALCLHGLGMKHDITAVALVVMTGVQSSVFMHTKRVLL